MIPNTALGLLVFLAAVAPGYLYQRIVETRVLQRQRSAWLEAVGLLCIGAACTTVSTIVILRIGEWQPSAFTNLRTLVANRSALIANPWPAAASVLAILTLSFILALLIAIIARQLSPRSQQRPGTVWSRTFVHYQAMGAGDDKRQRSLFVVAQLTDRRSISGQLLYADQATEPEQRDITLAAPVWITQPNGPRQRLDFDFVILQNKDISALWGRTLDLPQSQPPGGGPDSPNPDGQRQALLVSDKGDQHGKRS